MLLHITIIIYHSIGSSSTSMALDIIYFLTKTMFLVVNTSSWQTHLVGIKRSCFCHSASVRKYIKRQVNGRDHATPSKKHCLLLFLLFLQQAVLYTSRPQLSHPIPLNRINADEWETVIFYAREYIFLRFFFFRGKTH